MAGGRQFRQKLCLAVFLLFATVYAQSFALEIEHQQHESSQHCCLLCHAGPLALVQPDFQWMSAPVLWVGWLAYAPEFAPDHQLLLPRAASRAPPV